MSMHPVLTTSVYITIAVIFTIFAVSMIVYTRNLKAKKLTLEEKGRLPASEEEGILLATRKNEGRSGTP